MKKITKKEKRIDAFWTNLFEKNFKVEVKCPYNTDGYFEWKNSRVLGEFKSEKYDLDNLYTLISILCQSTFYIHHFQINNKPLPTIIFIATLNKYVVIPTLSILSYLNKNYDWNIPASKAVNYEIMINDILNDEKLVKNGRFIYTPYIVNKSPDINLIKELISIKSHYDNNDINSVFFSIRDKENFKKALNEDKVNSNDNFLVQRNDFLKAEYIVEGKREKGRNLAEQYFHTDLSLCKEMIEKTASFCPNIDNSKILSNNVEFLDPMDRFGIIDKNKVDCITDNIPKIKVGKYVWPKVSFTNEKYLESKNNMKYNKIFGNPPFHEIDDNDCSIAGGGVKFWEKFLRKSISKLEIGGCLCYITPSGWRNYKSKLFKDIFQKYRVHYINIGGAKKYFKDVSSEFDWYIIENNSPIKNTIVEWENETKIIDLSTIEGLPDNVEFLNIKEKFDKEIRHLECIRIQTHSIKPYTDKEKKIIPWIMSNTKSDAYIWPIKHTGASELYYSNKKHENQKDKKVILSYSGYLNPFYDDGKLGTTPHSFFIKVKSEEEGNFIVKLLNSNLYKTFLDAYKTNGFNDLKLIKSLPYPKIKNDFTDEELYDYFNLSNSEKSLVNSVVKNKTLVKLKTKIEPEDEFHRIHSEKSIKERGEVFTPMPLVREIIDKCGTIDKNIVKDILDNSCGNGNFLIEVLNKKIREGMSHLDALKTIYGIDIDENNVCECKKRLSLDSKDDEMWSILNRNIICADALDPNHKGWKSVGYMWNGNPQKTIEDFFTL
jgi:hypothetical protein